MKQHDLQDERVVVQRRKINSEAYGILMIVLFSSMIIQQFLLNAPFEQYAVEVIGFLGTSIYVTIRHITMGLDIYGGEKRSKHIPLTSSIGAGLVVTTINGILNYRQYAQQYAEDGIGYFFAILAMTFVSATVLSFIVLSIFDGFNKKKQASIQRRLDEMEDEE